MGLAAMLREIVNLADHQAVPSCPILPTPFTSFHTLIRVIFPAYRATQAVPAVSAAARRSERRSKSETAGPGAGGASAGVAAACCFGAIHRAVRNAPAVAHDTSYHVYLLLRQVS